MAPPPPPPPPPSSLRDYARHRGVSAAAVSKAVRDGRLQASVVMVGGAPKIANVELADREWEANTRPNAEQRAAAPAPEELAYRASRAARESMSLRRETAEAELAEIQLAERRGQLVSVEVARRDAKAMFMLVRNRLLGLPSRFAQRMAPLAAEATPVIEELIREALEELAADDFASIPPG